MAGQVQQRKVEVKDLAPSSTFPAHVGALVVGALYALCGLTFLVALLQLVWLSFGGFVFWIAIAAGFFGGARFAARGIYVNEPNQATVLTLYGRYAGTDWRLGPRWTNPLATIRTVSIRMAVTETPAIKVVDLVGDPVEVAVAVTWRVDSPAKAVFQVDDHAAFAKAQATAAVRAFAARHPYDGGAPAEGQERRRCLLRDGPELCSELAHDLSERVAVAGVTVEQVRLTHLAPGPEAAEAVAARIKAEASAAAYRSLLQGAVTAVKEAVAQMREAEVGLDKGRAAALAANLLLVLAGGHAAVPAIGVGIPTRSRTDHPPPEAQEARMPRAD